MKKIIHLLPNAHIDPVWLWDRREGLNEGIRTCRSMVKLMQEFPQLCFNRGEASIYQHIEQYDPKLFAEIRGLIESGRWEVVGGTWVQADHNMPATECLFRQFEEGQGYFQEKLGCRVETAWAPDSFGHSTGMPELFAANHMQHFAFTRPQRFTLPDDLFYWIGDGGSRILCYRLLAYTAERDVASLFESLIKHEDGRPRQNIGRGFGLGDHGGGTSHRQIEDALAWAEKHPDYEVRFSTFHDFFSALKKEITSGLDVAEIKGEINFCLRGCYASLPSFKTRYRQAENALLSADRINLLVSSYLKNPADELKKEWHRLLFNAFHDILPGSSIERAVNEQIDQIGAICDNARDVEFAALNRLATKIKMVIPEPVDTDTPTAIPMLVFNPLPYPYAGLIELEESLDYRPLYHLKKDDPIVEVRDAAGRELPIQEIKEEHNAMTHCVWRKRVVTPVQLPPLGWIVLSFGAKLVPSPYSTTSGIPAEALEYNIIRNHFWSIDIRQGKQQLELTTRSGTCLPLSFALYHDDFGSWGGMSEEPESFHLQDLLEEWTISQVSIIEAGPLRAGIWCRFDGSNSHVELTLRLVCNSPVIFGELRSFCRDRSCRLKLRFPMAERVVRNVPGGEAESREEGQFPALEWLKLFFKNDVSFGFAANGAYGYDNENNFFTYGITKSTAYASDEIGATRRYPELSVEAGSEKIDFLLTSETENIQSAAQVLRMPPRVLACWPHEGTLPCQGSLLTIESEFVRLLAIVRENNSFRLTLQNCSNKTITTRVSLFEHSQNVSFPPWKIIALFFVADGITQSHTIT